MGLAASQARFLAITARKADCEFRSMQIAQNKLSVTRELQAATEKYQNSLNAEMLIWDYDGTSSDLQAVSYSLMTKPSVYNNFTPYLLTDRGGRVIVSKEIAAAAAAAGIDPNKGGSRTESAFNQFINALASNNVISTQTVKQMTEAMYIVNNPSGQFTGLDGHVYTASKHGALCAVPIYVDDNGEYQDLVLKNNPYYTPWQEENYDYTKYYTGERNPQPEGTHVAYAIYTGNDFNKFGSPGAIADSVKLQAGKDKYIKFVEYSNYDPDNGYGSEPMSKNALTGMNLGQLANALKDGYVTNAFDEIKLENILVSQYDKDLVRGNGQSYSAEKNGVTYSSSSFDVISLSDVLTGNVVLYGHHEDGDHDYHADFNNFLDNYLKNAVIQIGIALGAYEEGTTDPANSTSYKDNDLGSMFAMAYQFTQAAFCEGASTVTTRKNGDSDTQKLAIEEAEATNHTIFYKNSGEKYNSTSAVSLSNMMSYFLTYVTILEDGFDSGYAVTDKVADSYFVTNDPSYRWVVNDEETETNEAVMKSDFYQQLFNNLCINGYKTDQRVKEDNDYLEQMLKNGSYFISSLGHDGHFYQTRYNDSENTLIKVVADEDAIAVAESEYNYMKIKLTAKEDKLDLDMKNIDLEISSLTTEYDSVKNLIAKSIEKTFKQFEG